MKQVFRPRGFFTVPDGTEVSPFLNATDAMQQDLPWGSLGDMSISAGRIGAKVQSWIHRHPVVTQVTYLLTGTLTVRMRDAAASAPYDLLLQPGHAVITEPGTLFQLRNDTDLPADVLYIVSPSYVFELDAGGIAYDDAILVARTWEDVAPPSDVSSATTGYAARASREESMRRLALRQGRTPPPMSRESIVPLNPERDYLAPDGSQIRLLAGGEPGGLAHCVLPAGKTSAAVRHRTVEELWYVLEGAGEMARHRDGEPPRVDPIRAGDSLRIPVGVVFQFRAGADSDLKLLIATMPPWPGAEEAVSSAALLRD